MKNERRVITYSTIGLVSLAIGLILSLINTGFGVHSGAILIWILFLGITIFAIPTILLFLSIYNIRTLGQEKSKVKTYSISITSILGLGLLITSITISVLMK